MVSDRPAPKDIYSELKALAALGYVSSASVKPGGKIACGSCSHVVPANEVEIIEVRRLEGPTDPSEARIILGLRCKECHHKSALALTYGSMSSSEDADVLQMLDGHLWPPTHG
jgi:hypothetical protein